MDPNSNDGWEQVPQQAPQQAPAAPAQGSNDGWEPVPQPSSQQPTQPHNSEIHLNHPWYTPTGIAERAGSTFQGIGEGVFKTAAGASDLVDNVTGMDKGGANKYLHVLAGDDNTPGTSNIYNKVGYGGETLTEFMMGDEALKGLSHADKLGTVSKWMKIAESSPRLLQALRTGADVEKIGAEAGLSPEAIQFIRTNPVIAKFVSIGMNAARAGATQGAQTLVRSGGDVKKAATDAVGTAATGAVLGTVAHGAASVLRKGGKAAQTVAEMNDVAASAPTSHEVENGVNGTVNDAFKGETGTLQNNLDDATSQVGMFGEGAPEQSAITASAQKAAKAGKQAVHDTYQQGFDHLTELAGDQTIPYKDSPLHKAAQGVLAETPESAGPLDEALGVTQPGSPKANNIVSNLADENLGADADIESEPQEPSGLLDANGKPIESAPAEPEEQEPVELNMQHLIARRQTIAKMIRNLGPNDRADREIYGKLLNGIDDTIGKLADSVGEADESGGEGESGAEPVEGDAAPKTAARQHFDAMNAAYKEGIRPFQNRDVKNILTGKLNNVAKSIMGGQTSVADIADVKQAVGQQNFDRIAKASLQNIVQSAMDTESGELDYKKLFKQFNRIDPQVRQSMFGDQGKALGDALKVAADSSTGLSEIGKQVSDMLGNGSVESLMKDPGRVKDIANVVGPDGMKVIGRSIFNNQIAKASTVLDKATGQVKPTHFDPDKVLDWWMGMKDSPEVRDALFTVDKDTASQYNDMMSKLAQASSVKKLVKYGVLPLTMGTAGVVHGPGAALFGALAGLGTEAGFGRARDILDSIANNPRTWKTLEFGGKVADKASAAVKQPARSAGAAAIYKTAQSALSGDNQ